MFDSIKKLFKGGNSGKITIQEFAHKDHFFYRCATWDWIAEKQIHINDPHGPRLITLDEWPQLVFLGANGKWTVAEYIDHMALLYTSAVPKDLDQTIIHQLNSLIDLRVIEFSEIKRDFDPKFDFALSNQEK